LLKENVPIVAPLALTPLQAALAEQTGFRALYLGGGSLGYERYYTEANLGLTEMCQAGMEIGTASSLPLILDGTGGWGDPMHLHRTIRMIETAGFAAVELEDQLLPKRAHHHVGQDHMIPMEMMVEKIREAVGARRNPDCMIIARTNAVREFGLDEALRRAEAYKKAGADMIFVATVKGDELRKIAATIEGPHMAMIWTPLTLPVSELFAAGYQLIVDMVSPFLASYVALKQAYEDLYHERPNALIKAAGGGEAIHKMLHETIKLETLLAVERRTVEK
jgi:methylisocitrate lyase